MVAYRSDSEKGIKNDSHARARSPRRTRSGRKDAATAERAGADGKAAPAAAPRKRSAQAQGPEIGGAAENKRAKKGSKNQAPQPTSTDARPKPVEYVLNPGLISAPRGKGDPVQPMTKLLLGDQALLVEEEQEDNAQEDLLKCAAKAMLKTLHSSTFIKERAIAELGDRKIPVNAALEQKWTEDFIRRMHDTEKLIDEYECGQLMKCSTHFEVLDKIQAEKLDLSEKLADLKKKSEEQANTAVQAIDNALGTVVDAVKGLDKLDHDSILRIINQQRVLLPFEKESIDYQALQSQQEIKHLETVRKKVGHAVSPEKSQKYFDKHAHDINQMSAVEAATKLESLHDKLKGAKVEYNLSNEEDFPASAADFKEKFGVSRVQFWKMKALEEKLSCPFSPGIKTNTNEKRSESLKHFASLSPSSTKKSLNFDSETNEKKTSEENSVQNKSATDKIEMLKPAYDKSFEKAVDWTKPAVKKIVFSSASIDNDIVQFFCDFEEVMNTRAPYTMYEEMLGRLEEPTVAASVREYTRNAVATMPTGDVVEKRKVRIASYEQAKKFLLEQYEDDERGAKLLKKFDSTTMSTGAKLYDNYVKYKMNLDKLRRQISVIEADMLSTSHFVRHYIDGLAPKLKQKLEESEDYDSIKREEAKLHSKLLKWSRAMQKAQRNANATTLSTITEEDENVDITTDDFKALRAFLNKRKNNNARIEKIKKRKKNEGKDSSTYVRVQDIQEKAFKNCYTAQEWKARRQAREQNEEYSKQPHLYNKDKLKGKLCCVKCRRVGHTADQCNRGTVHMQAVMKALRKTADAEDNEKLDDNSKKELLTLLKKLESKK